ncbi:MAG TPA: hypothetical protein VHQ65_01285 [Thermoanaerobaculia bacterium]|nr:hypothetical protein [Thermoanaerobaculia bacterium]
MPAAPVRRAPVLVAAAFAAALLVAPVPRALAQTAGPAELLAFVDPHLEPLATVPPITAPPWMAYGLLPAQLTTAGRQVFFVADDRQHGPELWVSDGTAGGTRQVVDLLPGKGGSQPWILGVVGERVVFWARTADLGVELHASDGTADGTALLSDTCPGGCNGAELPEHWLSSGEEAAAGAAPYAGGLAIPVREGVRCTLWATDGTPDGTVPVDPVGASCGLLESDGARVWYGDSTLARLRVFDAQAGGRAVALPRCPGSFFWLREAAPHAGELVVVGRCFGEPGDNQAWRVGPDHPAERISPRAAALSLLPHGDRLFLALAGAEGAPTPGGGYELMYLVGPGFGLAPFGRLPDSETVVLLAVQGEIVEQLLVEASLPAAGRRLLAVAPGGTGTVLADQEIHVAPFGAGPRRAWMGNQVVLFALGAGSDGEVGTTWELWTTGGTPASTRRVSAFSTPPEAPDGTAAMRLLVLPELAVLPESVVLSADDGAGQQLWGIGRGELSRWGCQPGPETLCLGGERFEVRVDWRDPRSGDTGSGRAHAAADVDAGPSDSAPASDSGYFWFFRPDNLELLVKVLDGTGVNGHHWVFHGPMTDVEYEVHVTDLATGNTRSYRRPAGTLCGGADTLAFPASGTPAAATSAATTAAPVPPEAARAPLSPPPPRCDPATALCLGEDDRFEVQVTFRDHRHGSGEPQAAHPVAETRDSGSFWFFRPDNREVLVKVIDGTPVNGRWWVFVGSMTDLAFEVRVFDTFTQGSGLWTSEHPAGSLCGTADTTALF